MRTAPCKPAVEDFLDYLRVERGASRNTVQAYARDLRRYVSSLQRRGVGDTASVRTHHVSDAMQDVAATGASAATIARALAAVRHFHRFCLREGLATTNPSAMVDAPSRGVSLPKALTVDDVVRIIEAADQRTPAGLRDRAMLELLYAAGIRASELVGLDVDDVDVDGRVVRCLGKGERERVVPIGDPSAETLSRYLAVGRPELCAAGRGTPAVFLSVRGGRLSRQSLWRVVKRYAARACPDARVFPHAMRHSFATHLVAGGADLRVVQEALGHARISTTQVYTLVTRQQLKDVLESAHPRGRSSGAPD